MTDHRILLVDPFKNLVNAYQMILEEETYFVDTALGITEAYRFLEKREYSVLITEYIPPFKLTEDMIKKLKENSPETYIIIVTNTAINEETYEKIFEIGVDDLIFKPYSPSKILVHIKKGLKKREEFLKERDIERKSYRKPFSDQTPLVLFNPDNFKGYFRKEFKKSRRHHRPFSLLLISIPGQEKTDDRLKDSYVELADILRKNLREEDVIGRENGNFGVLLPETDQIGSQALEKRISCLFQTHPALQTLSLKSFTYPDKFVLPESLRGVIEKIDKEQVPT
jgi:PleD family two-component response regulator